MSKLATAQPLNTFLVQILCAVPIGSKLSVERLARAIRMSERTVRTAIRSLRYGRLLVNGVDLCAEAGQTTPLAGLCSEMPARRTKRGVPTNVAAS